jgi:C-terminal processing protease CtpA/Prc
MRSGKRLVGFLDIWDLVREEENDEHFRRPRYAAFGNQAFVLKLHDFEFDFVQAHNLIDKARSYDTLILDLRGNPGGYVEGVQHFLGSMFDHEVKIGDRITRKGSVPVMTKGGGHKPFQGKLLVLIDSQSASAAEVFARVLQLNKRGTVIGDRSAGMVMESKMYPHEIGVETAAFYGVTITDADLIMTDGKSLERVGVTPDERVLPSAADLAAGRDPALARAAELAGVKLSPEEAGKLFPVEWPHRD